MVAQPKQVPLFVFQSTPMTFWTVKIKSQKVFFSVPFQLNSFYLSTGRRGTTNNKKKEEGVTGQGYIGGGHVHHVALLTPLSLLLFCYKNCGVPSRGGTVSWSTDAWRAPWWLEESHRIRGKCVRMWCKKGKYVCVCVRECEGVFHVSSTVTVRTRATHVSPSVPMRETPSVNTTETADQAETHLNRQSAQL